jgi:hypothetical protein
MQQYQAIGENLTLNLCHQENPVSGFDPVLDTPQAEPVSFKTGLFQAVYCFFITGGNRPDDDFCVRDQRFGFVPGQMYFPFQEMSYSDAIYSNFPAR